MFLNVLNCFLIPGPREDTKSAAGMLCRRVVRIEMWEVEEGKEKKGICLGVCSASARVVLGVHVEG